MSEKIFTNQQCASLSIEWSADGPAIHVNLPFKRSISDPNICPLAYFDWLTTWEAASKVITEHMSEQKCEHAFGRQDHVSDQNNGSVMAKTPYPYELLTYLPESDQAELRASATFPPIRIFFNNERSWYYEFSETGVSLYCQYSYNGMTLYVLIGSGLSVSLARAKAMTEKFLERIVPFLGDDPKPSLSKLYNREHVRVGFDSIDSFIGE